ncbi:hypothetical protein Btru_068691 [Bulinus truncatus]|nr:hypothetical protein Btru_068691 [Bulinus truncatus]
MHLDPCFDTDVTKLSQVFKETQKKLHPDKFSTKSETERKLAEEQSSLLNKAYNVLLKPLSRAIYLLELQGVSIEDNSDFQDSELLMEVMQINEKISSIQNDCDLDEIEISNNSRIEDCILQLSKTFKSRSYQEAKALTIKLRYYTTVQDRINNLRRSKLG